MGLLTKRGDLFPSAFGGFFDDYFKEDFMVPSFIGNAIPAVNISEDKERFIIEVAAPGMNKKDFILNLQNNMLTISCEKKTESKDDKEEEGQKYARREFKFSSFQRSFTLPEVVNAEKIDATYKEGILYIELPKRAEAKKGSPKQIKIS